MGHHQADGPRRGTYYHLYVILDIFSRCAVQVEVHATASSATWPRRFMIAAILR